MTINELIAKFDDLHASLIGELAPDEAALVARAIAQPPKSGRTYGFEDVGDPAKALLAAIASLPGARASIASRAVIAGLCVRSGARLGDGLTPKVKARSADALQFLADWLSEKADDSYRFPDDYFLKDYRFATGMTLPCGAQVVDLAERPGIKTIVTVAAKSPLVGWHAAMRPWFRPHTESRYLSEFNEDGWNRCFAEIGDLLAVMSDVAGMIATSWFYDPKLEEISPRLAYLRRVPCDAGAIMVCHGTTDFDIKSSTATSPTRRELYEQGKYMPTCWSIVWPRDAMLAWCAEYRRKEAAAITAAA